MRGFENIDHPWLVVFGLLAFGGVMSTIEALLDNPPVLTAFFTAVLTVATIVLAIATMRLWHSTNRIAEHSVVSERAYVKLSHLKPGLEFDHYRPDDTTGYIVTVFGTNSGRTPARVTDVLLKVVHGSLPALPEYSIPSDHEITRTFLVTQDLFRHKSIFSFPTGLATEARTGTIQVFIYGYVDYIDVFNERHRAGYARVYSPGVDEERPGDPERNNLTFISTPGYNYDRLRNRGEGNDWNETAD